jgi:hypothetical protein
MPRKSRKRRGKYAYQDKKRTQAPAVTTTESPVAAHTDKPATPPPETAPPVSVPTPAPTPIVARYPYIGGELRRIGILAGIMIAVLVILSLVLS